MLTIIFTDRREWWVSGSVFERLLSVAIAEGHLPRSFEVWGHEADANGGLYLPERPTHESAAFMSALRHSALEELDRTSRLDSASADATYISSLKKLLDVLDSVNSTDMPIPSHAGQPCPRTGWWLTPAQANSRQHFEQGQLMPSVGGDYGVTIWQWDERQD